MRQPLIAEDYGDFISVSGENIILKNKESAVSVPITKLSYIAIKGSFISFSSAVILKCLKRNIPIILLDSLGRPYSVIRNIWENDYIKQRQSEYSSHFKSVGFVSYLLKEKVRKQHQVLYYHIRSLRLNSREEIKTIEGYNFKIFLNSFNALAKRRVAVGEISRDIFLLEARASRSYWRAFSKLFPKSLFPGRKKRHSEDPINKLLNYGYALLSSLILRDIIFTGLNPTVPLLHHRRTLDFPFVFDLMEPFRPINDHIVLSFFHKQKKLIVDKNGQIKKSVLKRFRRFWFKEMAEPQPWSKSKKSIEKLIKELIEKYKTWLTRL